MKQLTSLQIQPIQSKYLGAEYVIMGAEQLFEMKKPDHFQRRTGQH